MRRTFLTILITALVTSAGWYVVTSIRRGAEALWLMSAVKAPGRMALDRIQQDFAAGRDEVAKAKLAALRRQWAVFEDEPAFRGQAIGNILGPFFEIDEAMKTRANTESGRRE